MDPHSSNAPQIAASGNYVYVVWGDITVGTGSSIDPVTPTKIHIRKEFVKTKVSRDIYISDEATRYLKQWLEWKYNNKERLRTVNQDDLAFTLHTSANPNTVYVKILEEFEKLLAIAGLDERKEGMTKRRKITLHSLRRFVKTVISDQVNQDYSEWFLGHNKSPYYTKKETERREIYASKCMKYLTFLDYSTLETTGKNIEAKLSERKGNTTTKTTGFYEYRCNSHFVGSVSQSNGRDRDTKDRKINLLFEHFIIYIKNFCQVFHIGLSL